MTKYAQVNGVGRQGIGALPDAELDSIASDNPNQAFVISLLQRPGFGEFLQELEYKLYTPDSNRNALFEMFLVKWEGLIIVVAAFPKEDLAVAQEIAAQFEIRLEAGTLLSFGGESGHSVFPIKERENVLIAQGTCKRLEELSDEEQRRLFIERETQLQKEYHVIEG